MNLEIVTKQEKIFESDNTLQITVPTIEGEITILSDHQNLVTILAIGEINIVTSVETKKIFILFSWQILSRLKTVLVWFILRRVLVKMI